MKDTTRKATKLSPARQVERFIAKFDPAIAALARSSRSALRKRFPTALELVYDNYNALAIGWSPTVRSSDAIVSLAVFPRGVSLYFMHGARLADPSGALQGSGNQGRFIRLAAVKTLDEPVVKALVEAATRDAKTALPRSGRGSTVIKSVSARQRPRRTTGSVRRKT